MGMLLHGAQWLGTEIWLMVMYQISLRNGKPLALQFNDVYGPVIPAISFCRNKTLTLRFPPLPPLLKVTEDKSQTLPKASQSPSPKMKKSSTTMSLWRHYGSYIMAISSIMTLTTGRCFRFQYNYVFTSFLSHAWLLSNYFLSWWVTSCHMGILLPSTMIGLCLLK